MLKISDMVDNARYSYLLERLIENLNGERVLYLNYESDYQGFVDIDVLLADGKVFSYMYWYGSCSGCDEWECINLSDEEIIKEMKRAATYFDNLNDYKIFANKTNREEKEWH